MSDLKESVKRVMAVGSDYTRIKSFCIAKLYEEFKYVHEYGGSFRMFKEFRIKSEDEIEIVYEYGAGDMDYTGYLTVKVEE